jgi:hypothetical protein
VNSCGFDVDEDPMVRDDTAFPENKTFRIHIHVCHQIPDKTLLKSVKTESQ